LRRLHAILDSIKPKKRVAFVLFAVKGHTVGEIAELVGAPVPTVKSRIWFARRELRKKARRDPYLAQLLEELEENDER
ncbi:MAG TPA: sigma factor-like helix-turn-helix DNA-binding protein, partial [Polyangia bacterium]|nr:sigma factor-like helix-turn-helix DNA-binding protein [Polyangia bacterium]